MKNSINRLKIVFAMLAALTLLPSCDSKSTNSKLDANQSQKELTAAQSALRSAGDRFRLYLLNDQWMGDVFRAGYSRKAAKELAAKIDGGDYSWLPAVELFDETNSGAYIDGRRIYDATTRQPTALMGAYKGGTVYWNRWLTRSGIPAPTIDSVAAQELAHHIDSIVNPNGAKIGGEGVIAVAKFFGPALTAEQITGLQSYRDHADIFVNGKIVTDVELGFWRNGVIIGAVIVVVVVAAVAVSVLAPEVLVLGSSTIGGALPVAAAEADATALAAVAAGEQTTTVATAVNTERTALLGVRSVGALTRSTRVWGNLDQTAQIVSRFREFRVGNVARNVNVGRLEGLVSSGSGELSLREAAIEDISGSPFSQGWGIVARDPNLLNIYRQVAVQFNFDAVL